MDENDILPLVRLLILEYNLGHSIDDIIGDLHATLCHLGYDMDALIEAANAQGWTMRDTVYVDEMCELEGSLRGCTPKSQESA